MISIDGSTGTDVKSASTSNDIISKKSKNQHGSRPDHLSSKILLNNHLFHLPGKDI